MAVNVKVGLIGPLDMLKFKNMAKVREQVIQAAPADEITGEFSVNKLAKLEMIAYKEKDDNLLGFAILKVYLARYVMSE